MVGIVVVSHSHRLVEGAVELAAELAGIEVSVRGVGGLDAPGRPLGTDPVQVAAAIAELDNPDGVLVLADIGSAVLSAEMALEFLTPEQRGRVRISSAPLVEGLVAAVVQAKLGADLATVDAEARGALSPKQAHLGVAQAATGTVTFSAERAIRLRVTNRLGLHARPAVRLVTTAARFDARVQVSNATSGVGPADAGSLNAIATLGVGQGDEILVEASGREAEKALAALTELAEAGFGDIEPETPVSPSPPQEGEGWQGVAASPGIALGPARHLRSAPITLPAGPGSSPAADHAALAQAIAATQAEITATRKQAASRVGDYAAAIFDAHLLHLTDPELLEPARIAIDGGEHPARAWDQAVVVLVGRYRGLDDPYLRERAADVRSVGDQVLAHLLGQPRTVLPEAGILVAAELSPAEAAGLDPARVIGIATAGGGPTSHTSILAKALGIPAVAGLGPGLLEIVEGTSLLLDGSRGKLMVDPDSATLADFEAERSRLQAAARDARAGAAAPAITRDGRRIEIAANLGREHEAATAIEHGADGVGLLRTEFLFLGRDRMPTEDEQTEIYSNIGEGLGGRPLVLRTLDVGGDKPLGFLSLAQEANPFLGVRGLRLGLSHPELLLTQLRAAWRVAADHPLRVMFPMVSTLEEVEQAITAVEQAGQNVRERGIRCPERLEIGIMVETPAAALIADRLASRVDFFSIGTNDLTQYTLAAERGNPALAPLNDPLHPAVLRLIRMVVDAAEAAGRWVGVCGDAAGDQVAIPILVGLGVTELSMAAPLIPAAKLLVRTLDYKDARAIAERALTLSTAAEVRGLVGGWTSGSGYPS